MKRISQLMYLGIVSILFLFTASVFADEVDYSIPSYQGILTIHEDNSATFIEAVTYSFDSSYNGQYVTLGKAGNMPDGFDIEGNPSVLVSKNGTTSSVTPELENLSDGYRLKIYNSGSSGDKVTVTVTWRLKNILYKYEDIAELNWVPISDWDETLQKVDFTVETDKSASKSQLFAHLGYLKSVSQISQEDNSYHISTSNVSGKLELHAYWNSDIISGQAISSSHLKTFLSKEDEISRNNQRLLKMVNLYLPLTVLGLFVLAYLLYSFYKKSINRYYLKPVRLYEMPDNLSPLAVSQLVYNQSLYDLSPLGKGGSGGRIDFKNLLQAELLDLIDKKAISIEKEASSYRLTLTQKAELDDFESDFIRLAFGANQTLMVSQLFSDYYFDEQTEEKLKQLYMGSDLEEEMRRSGNRVINRLKKQATAISDKVKASLSDYPKTYRDVTSRESGLTIWSGIILTLVAILSICVFFYLIYQSYFEPVFLFYIVTGIASVFGLIYLIRESYLIASYGALTPEGGQIRQLWESFDKMMEDIGNFKEAELESLIIWNRMLVYATLFGRADKVEHYMKIRQIDVSDQQLVMIYPYLTPHLGYVSGQFHHSLDSAQSASHFSISSGGSSGGFSGGGGGGGGGAF
ncbi:DUF2207 domain-containing protein [Streptococcus loxodontisalivarius]|uniref:Membrane protein n=1 Tax=Streptococcus loxodontisalivarius TaxID=1349415 RepID=A0ABS2PT82_9STRE|nr:DUF2207 domain-containing protein [Streptococcus loxodontisalivarius]MBM7643246.1 putative membrane protein [Streptococcus loxodontisalivarius]